MGVEILASDVTPALVKNGIDGESTFLPEVDNKVQTNLGQKAEEPIIQFGMMDSSDGGKEEGKHATGANFPQNASEEWPEALQIHTFYFVKVRAYEDPKLKAQIEQADMEVQKKNKARLQITEALKAKRSERAQVISQLKPLTTEGKRYRSMMDEKRKEMEPLKDALGKLRGSSNVGLCSSEEELNYLIQSLHYRMQHESNTLSEEKQLLKEIKLLEGTREKVIAYAAAKAKIQDSLGQKEAIQDQVKLIGVDIGGVKKEKQAVRTKIKQLEDELKAIDAAIASLQDQLEPLTEKREKAFENFSVLIKSRQELNTSSRENRSILNIAKDLAAKKDIQALQELCHCEVEKFMSQWSTNKAFRDDYERRILSSLDSRQLTKDGRQRNPDEKPIIVESSLPPPPVVEHVAPVKTGGKREKEDGNLSNGVVSSHKTKVEDHHKPTEEFKEKASLPQEKEYASSVEKSQEKPVEIDAAKLKETKREEELAKANLARERKKKLAEKAAARATARAQKEAEKKIKEKEKRAKKNAGVTEPSADQTEFEEKLEEPAEVAGVTAETSVPTKSEELKNKPRYRNQAKMQDQLLPKRILKRKKSSSYLLWAAPAAILAVVLVVLVYYYQNN